MIRTKPLLIAILVFSFMSLTSSLADAEIYVDIYGGLVQPLKEDVTVKGSAGGMTLEITGEVDYDSSFAVGGRVGFWHTEIKPSMSYVGVALDVSYFKTEADVFGTDIDVVPVTVLIMLRHPGDTFQPYLGVGGGIFISHIEQDVDLTAIGSGNWTLSDTSVDAGFDARAGLGIKVHKNFAVFGEGRYTYFSPDYNGSESGVSVKVNTDYNVVYFQGGISYRF